MLKGLLVSCCSWAKVYTNEVRGAELSMKIKNAVTSDLVEKYHISKLNLVHKEICNIALIFCIYLFPITAVLFLQAARGDTDQFMSACQA